MGVLGDTPTAAHHPKAFYENSLSSLCNSLQDGFGRRVEVGRQGHKEIVYKSAFLLLRTASLPSNHLNYLGFGQGWTTKFNESSCEFEKYVVFYHIESQGFCCPLIWPIISQKRNYDTSTIVSVKCRFLKTY